MKIAIEIQADGEFCLVCRNLSSYRKYCTMFNMDLEWGGEHNNLLKRCQQCIDAEIGEK